MINIFEHLIIKIQNFLSKEKSQRKNYDPVPPDKVYFDDDYFYLEGQQYNISDLKKVEYGTSYIDENIEVCNIRFYFLEKTLLPNKAYLIGISILIETMKKFSILVLPTILERRIEFVMGFSLTHYGVSLLEERGLINLCKDKDDIFYLFKCLDGGIYKQINSLDDINLKSFLENPRINLKEFDDSYDESFDNAKFRLVVLDKTLTLNSGYGIYPVLNNQIIIDDIFYSFNEEEIKNKIIELFEKHNK